MSEGVSNEHPPNPQEPTVTPDLNGNTKGEPLYEYFKQRLPADLPREVYEEGLTCLGFAKLFIDALGGPQKARAIWVDDKTGGGHAYVIPKDPQIPTGVYNKLWEEDRTTLEEIEKKGLDITDDIFSRPWERL